MNFGLKDIFLAVIFETKINYFKVLINILRNLMMLWPQAILYHCYNSWKLNMFKFS